MGGHIFKNIMISMLTFSIATAQDVNDREITITRSASFNYHAGYKPGKAHDGNYDTRYSVKDGAVAGNFLKLFLSRAYRIGVIKITSRPKTWAVRRMLNTAVSVYSTDNEETEVASCGVITVLNLDDTQSVEGRTYTLYCGGARGDMLYLTDRDYDADNGHNIAEVKIYQYDKREGPEGPQGEQGAEGEKGAEGDEGYEGEKGTNMFCLSDICLLKGAPGEPGTDGEDGAPGESGDEGAVGEKGWDGANGDDGDDGRTGEPGPNGESGYDANDGLPGLDAGQYCKAGSCGLQLGHCYGRGSSTRTVQCMGGYAAVAIWRNARFWGLKCCKIVVK